MRAAIVALAALARSAGGEAPTPAPTPAPPTAPPTAPAPTTFYRPSASPTEEFCAPRRIRDRLETCDDAARYGDTACGVEGRCVDYRAKVLFIPSPAHQFSPSGQVLATTRDYVYSLLAPLDTREPKQIVVLSRKKTATRRWVNEDACVLALRAAFPNERIVVYPDSGLPSDEMVRLFARAKVVLGPHGGGFASIMGCCASWQ